MKLISNKLTLALMATLLSLMSLFSHADKLSDIQKRGELIVAVPQDFTVLPVTGQTLSEELVDITEDDFIILLGIRRRTKSFQNFLSYLKSYNHLLISDQSGQKYAQQSGYFFTLPNEYSEPLDSYSTPMVLVSFLSNHIYRFLGPQANEQSALVSNIYRELDELE